MVEVNERLPVPSAGPELPSPFVSTPSPPARRRRGPPRRRLAACIRTPECAVFVSVVSPDTTVFLRVRFDVRTARDVTHPSIGVLRPEKMSAPLHSTSERLAAFELASPALAASPLLSHDALAFVVALEREFGARRRELLERRMADFEGSSSPTGTNCIEGQEDLFDTVLGTIELTNEANSKQYSAYKHI